MRFLLQEKDEWKISFRDQLETYSYLWIVQLRQDKTKEALLTAERGRAQALGDLHGITVWQKINSIIIKRADGKNN